MARRWLQLRPEARQGMAVPYWLGVYLQAVQPAQEPPARSFIPPAAYADRPALTDFAACIKWKLLLPNSFGAHADRLPASPKG
jgi:hypothetical protein